MRPNGNLRLGDRPLKEKAAWPSRIAGQAPGLASVGLPGFAGGTAGKKLRFAFGAQFVDACVHDRTREVRVARTTGAFAAGRNALGIKGVAELGGVEGGRGLSRPGLARRTRDRTW